jgi:hypothetical protein
MKGLLPRQRFLHFMAPESFIALHPDVLVQRHSAAASMLPATMRRYHLVSP